MRLTERSPGTVRPTPIHSVSTNVRARWGSLLVLSATATLAVGCGSSPHLTPSQLLDAGVAAQGQGHLDKARSDYLAVLHHDPTNRLGLDKIAWFDLGDIDQQQNNIDAAQSEYQQALIIDPHYVNALYNLAVLQALPSPTAAIALYRQVIALAPRDANALNNLGLLLYRAGQVPEGRSLLIRALTIAPSLAAKLPAGINLTPPPSPTPTESHAASPTPTPTHS